MKIEESFTLQAPRDRVFAFLSDVEQVAGCVPGVENLAQDEAGAWQADLTAQLGPIRAAFHGQVELTATPPGRLEAAGRGQDRASGSRAEVAFAADVEPAGEATTTVDVVADVTIRGRLGQFGTGVIRATATELIRDFVTCADARLQEDPAQRPAGRPPVPPPQQPPPGLAATAALVGRIAVRTLATALRSVWRRIRSMTGRR